ncbi:8-oxoguanine glycosylase ogg1 [Coemansia sp. RSA 2681]|nr:8-oxoguanine glycosylase ogg1 [Coemansia sp. RSA 2681]
MKLSGVGPKVADCVLLMSLDKTDAVPVDTHIWQVAKRRYVDRLIDTDGALPLDRQEKIRELARQLSVFKSPSTKAYELAQELIVALFSPYAGWAQGMLFSDDLVVSPDAAVAKPKPKPKPKSAATKRKAEVLPIPSKKRAGLRSSTLNSLL